MMSSEYIQALTAERVRDAKKNMLWYTDYTIRNFDFSPFHIQYFKVLDLFAKGKIKKLMISVPPQHGKSTGSSQIMPSYMLGMNPDLNIAIGCYNFTLARKFGRYIKNICESKEYVDVFGKRIPESSDSDHINTAEEIELLGGKGNLKLVGVGGGLTGNPVDVMIMDDLYKDFKDACSPIIRENVWDWYTSVVRTRLHNDSQQLIVFTRWHEDDLIGRIAKYDDDEIINLEDVTDLEDLGEDVWLKVNFEAIKTTEKSKYDKREKGEALWSNRHSIKKLKKDRNTDPQKFESLYQGNPESKEGMLYGDNFKTYTTLPICNIRKSYIDTADTGDDYLLAINYDVGQEDGLCYVTDVLYTQEPMEVTEPATASFLERNNVNLADIESNNGARSFARVVDENTSDNVLITWFHQSENKEARINSQYAQVLKYVVMPADWHIRWSEFYQHVTKYKKKFSANEHDEVADVLTGIIEKKDTYVDDFWVSGG